MTGVTISLRSSQSTPLTSQQVDANFQNLADAVAGAKDASQVMLTQSGAGAVPIALEKLLRDSVSPLQFGAIGDGTADDTAAVVAAKAQAELSGKALYLPGGHTFTCSTDLVIADNAVIYGDSQSTSTLKMTGAARIVSRRTSVVDYAELRNFRLLQGGTATTGLDIGTLRRSLVQNVYVQGFKVGVALDIGVSLVANYWNRLFNVTADCTGQTASGSVGFLMGNATNATYPDTDYNNLVGCKSFNCETAVKGVNMIGCKITGHQATVVGTALTLTSGNNNEVQMIAENCTNMGSAGVNAIGNKLDLYNDGGVASAFVDNGWNHHGGHIIGTQIIGPAIKTMDSFVRDRINLGRVAATTDLFRVTLGATEFAATVTLTCAGYTQATADFGGVQVWDIIKLGGGTPVATLIRSTGTNKFTVTTAADGSCTWAIAGHATNLTVANTSVLIQGIGTPQASPYVARMKYERLVA